jgi:hypothetical protein
LYRTTKTVSSIKKEKSVSKKFQLQPYRKSRVSKRFGAAVVLLLVALFVPQVRVQAASFSSASVNLSDPRPSASSSYTVTVSSVSATALRCIRSTYVTTPSGSTAISAPFTSAAATIGASTLLTGSTGSWSISNSQNVVTYTNTTNATVPSVTTGATFVINGITNGSTVDTSYWLQFRTYSDSGCTAPIDNVTVGFIYTNGSTLSLTVDNTLSFTVNAVAGSQSCNGTTTTAASTATTIPFGTVSAASNGVVCQDLTAATNATGGYTIYARYTAAPTNSLSQTLSGHSGTNAAPTTFSAAGTEAYGYSTNDGTLGTGTAARFTSGGQKWAAMTSSNAELAFESTGISSSTYRVGHQVGVSLTTRPGTYTTTVIYTCTPVY